MCIYLEEEFIRRRSDYEGPGNGKVTFRRLLEDNEGISPKHRSLNSSIIISEPKWWTIPKVLGHSAYSQTRSSGGMCYWIISGDLCPYLCLSFPNFIKSHFSIVFKYQISGIHLQDSDLIHLQWVTIICSLNSSWFWWGGLGRNCVSPKRASAYPCVQWVEEN